MRLTYAGRDYELAPGESVLEGLTRHGVRLPSACRAGACHSCLLRAAAGDPGKAGRDRLKPALAARGYFLACLARPVADLTIAAGVPDAITRATLAASRWLAPGVLAVRLRPHRPVTFRAGQHVTLHRGTGVVRTYSIANLPGEAARDGLEFHIRVYPDGALSAWLAQAPTGTAVGLGVPAGECFYLPGDPATALLLAGTGTGIGPLLAIARDALARGHSGTVTIIHGAAQDAGLYLGRRQPSQLGGPAAGQIRWRTCVRAQGGDISEAVTAELSALKDPAATRAFLCGGTGSVAAMRRSLFLAGMSLRDICADQFVSARASQAARRA